MWNACIGDAIVRCLALMLSNFGASFQRVRCKIEFAQQDEDLCGGAPESIRRPKGPRGAESSIIYIQSFCEEEKAFWDSAGLRSFEAQGAICATSGILPLPIEATPPGSAAARPRARPFR